MRSKSTPIFRLTAALLTIMFVATVVTAAPDNTAAAAGAPPATGALGVAASAYLVNDFQSGQTLVGQNVTAKVEPASLTKLMTAYLVFAAIRDNKLALDQRVPVSEHAWRAEGSRMFIDPKVSVSVEELLHGMITQSGNDASIALAEAVAGSEQAFAEMMNKQARQLGMGDTNFTNATGLPNPQHYSSAQDLGTLATALIRDFPERYALYSLKEYRYNNITQPNRNRLLWLDPTVDGVKTGHTEKAGYCLIASAKRGERRLISVVLGTGSEAARAAESQKLLNYGFQFFDTRRLFKAEASIASVPVYKGAAEAIKVGFNRDLYLSLPRQDFERLKSEMTTQQPLLAPIKRGQKVGSLKITLDDKIVGEHAVLALEEIAAAGFFGRLWDSLRLMMK